MHKQLSTSFSHHLVQAMALHRHKTSGSAIQSTAQVSAQAQVTAQAQAQAQVTAQAQVPERAQVAAPDQEQIWSQTPP